MSCEGGIVTDDDVIGVDEAYLDHQDEKFSRD